METKKIVPIVITVILVIAGIFIYTKNTSKEKGYERLTVSYNNSSKDYEIKVGTVIEEIEAEIISTEGNKIVVHDYAGNDTEIKLNEEKQICKKANDCAIFALK